MTMSNSNPNPAERHQLELIMLAHNATVSAELGLRNHGSVPEHAATMLQAIEAHVEVLKERHAAHQRKQRRKRGKRQS